MNFADNIGSYRKMQVYESAVGEALTDGGISKKERVLLNHLRDSLEISPVDAETLEYELQKQKDSHAGDLKPFNLKELCHENNHPVIDRATGF